MSAVELATRWEPTRTRVLAVGILQYADRICWPLEGRRDAVLMETLRARGVRLPVIIITGHGDIPMSVRAMKAGAVDFLPKPVVPEALYATTLKWLDRN